jgi:Mn-containing catalase
MKSLRFGFIRERFLRMRSSPQVARRAKILMYVLPGLFGLMAATSHYITQQFVVYLKYQALVDAYYHQKVLGVEKQ